MSDDRMPELPRMPSPTPRRRPPKPSRPTRVAVFGPFTPLLRSPELMQCASRMGLYLRYNSVLPLRISEFAILIVAREWSQQSSGTSTTRSPSRPGSPPRPRRPWPKDAAPPMSEDETLAYDFSMELQRFKAVSDRPTRHSSPGSGSRGRSI